MRLKNTHEAIDIRMNRSMQRGLRGESMNENIWILVEVSRGIPVSVEAITDRQSAENSRDSIATTAQP